MPRSILRRLVIPTVLGLAVAGCASSSDSTESGTEVTAEAVESIQVTGPASPPSLPLLRMQETAALPEVEMVFERWETADQLITSVTEGVDFAAAPLTTGAVLASQGAEVKMINVSAWDVSGIVTRDTAVMGIEDLAGKTVHVAMQGSAVDYSFQLILEHHGLTDSVTLEYVDPLNGPEQFLAGQIDTLVTVEPQLTTVLANAADAHAVGDFQQEWEALTETNLQLPTAATFVNAEFAEAHPELVDDFVAAYADAADWVAQNPGDAAALAAEELGLPAPVLEAAIPKMSWNALPAEQTQEEVMLYFELLYEQWPQSVGGEPVDAESFFFE